MNKPGVYPKMEVRCPGERGNGKKCDLYLGPISDNNEGDPGGYWFEFKQVRGDFGDEVKSVTADATKLLDKRIAAGHAFLMVASLRWGKADAEQENLGATYLERVMDAVRANVSPHAVTLVSAASYPVGHFDPNWYEADEWGWYSMAAALYAIE